MPFFRKILSKLDWLIIFRAFLTIIVAGQALVFAFLWDSVKEESTYWKEKVSQYEVKIDRWEKKIDRIQRKLDRWGI